MMEDPKKQLEFARQSARENAARRAASREKERTPLHRALRWGAAPLKSANTYLRAWQFGKRRRKILDAYLAKPGFKGLQFGCGPNRMDGWLNCDVLTDQLPWRRPDPHEMAQDFPLDITRPLPLDDQTFDALYGEEIIEHVDKDYAEAFLYEAFRVLKPGGILRMTTPDLDGTCRAFLRLDSDVDPDAFEPVWYVNPWSAENWINATFRDFGHLYLWNFTTLEAALKAAGFSEIWRVKQSETRSGMAELEGAERRTQDPGSDFDRFTEATRLIVEARR